MMPEIKLYKGDCIAAMKEIDDKSVSLIVTDPPYNLGNFMKNRDTNLSKMRDNFFGSAGWDDMEFDEWEKDEISVTITTRFDTPSSGKFTHPFLNRAITVREAARIQSFPDTFRFIGNKGSQMKQVGNAVPPLLAAAIAEVIMKDIKEEKNNE